MKKISNFLLSFMLLIAFTQPIVASAQDVTDEAEQTEEQQENENSNEETEQEETPVDEENGEGTPVDEENGVPLIQDGNQVVEDDNVDVRKQPIETPSSVTGEKYQGSGTVVDFTTSGSRYIYTIQTPDNNVFYLMIDMDMTENNVFFLSALNQEELPLNNASNNQQTQQPPVEEVPVTNTEEVATNEEEVAEQGSNATFWIILILMTIGILGYHLFFGKLKNLNPLLKDKDKEVEIAEFDNIHDVYNEGLVSDDDESDEKTEETEADEK